MVKRVLTQGQERRLARALYLDGKRPEKYCWAELASWALEEDKRARIDIQCLATDLRHCKVEGHCWCGKFVDGKVSNKK